MTMEYGVVTSVREESGIVYCDVQAIRKGVTYNERPVLRTHSGFIQVPEQGNVVSIEKFKDDIRFISGVVSDNGQSPGMTEGELAIKLDAGTQLYFEKRRDGNFNINIEASGEVNVNAHDDNDVNVATEDGDVNLSSDKAQVSLTSENGIIIDGIPFGNHVHDYVDDEISDTDDGTGSETAQDKTTNGPKDGTN